MGSIALLFLFCSVCVDSVDSQSRPSPYDVVIVGAGASGLAAAKNLLQNPSVRVLVLEGKSYTGGRVHAVSFGSEVKRGIIELGANWIHGVPYPTTSSQQQQQQQHQQQQQQHHRPPPLPRVSNPEWAWAKSINLTTVRVPGSSGNVSGYTLFSGSGVQAGPGAARKVMKAWRCANATAVRNSRDHAPDQSFKHALAACGWDARGALDAAMEWEVTSADDIVPDVQQSLLWTLPDATYSQLGPDDHFVHDQRPRGYAAVLDTMMGHPLSPPPPFLHLNSTVKRIQTSSPYCRGLARVVTGEGSSYCTRFVISTLPLGVMQHSHATVFDLPLPPSQASALDAITMGNFTKIFIQFKTQFWAARGLQWIAAASTATKTNQSNQSNQSGQSGQSSTVPDPLEFHDLGALIPGLNTLFTYVVGRASAEWEALDDGQAMAALVARLRKLFPREAVGDPTAFYMTRHGSDPLMRGAYSTMKTGVTFDTFHRMRAPLVSPRGQKTVFFAGEHTCMAFNGYLHGALYSGRRAAGSVLAALGMDAGGEGSYNGECERAY